jgi:PAS domain S-box-containing protein
VAWIDSLQKTMRTAMLERQLFALLEHTADAAYTITERGEICSWNTAAEQLFGYSARDILGRNIDEVTTTPVGKAKHPPVGSDKGAIRRNEGESGGIPDFDREVRIRSGKFVWVNVSTIVYDTRGGRRLVVQLVRDIDHQRRNEELVNQMVESARQLLTLAHDPAHHATVESLSEQELRILKLFAEGSGSATIAKKLRISPQTLRNHLHNINRKLRTHSRLEAVTHAQRRGLIE